MTLRLKHPGLALLAGGIALSVALAGLGGSEAPDPTSEPPTSLTADQSCATPGCHARLDALTRPHLETETGDAADALCLACHPQPQSREHRFERAAATSAICLQCHDDPRAGHARLHAPVVMGDCTDCHTVHAEPTGPMLAAPEQELCGNCHVRFAQSLAEADLVHDPAQTTCSACHDGHASDHGSLLHARSPELCRDCHTAAMDAWQEQAVQHEGVVRGGSCRKCHDPHKSDRPTLLKADWFDLCMQCHVDEVEMPGQPAIPALGEAVLAAEFRHEPVDEEGCAACHTAHAGPHADLLRAAYPAELYTPFRVDAYALCFDCHDPRLISEATDAPTAFSDAGRNLHYVHVVEPAKGRACHTCHDPHGAPQPHLMRENARFGAWSMTLRYEQTERGGRCESACHQPQTYDRSAAATIDESSRP